MCKFPKDKSMCGTQENVELFKAIGFEQVHFPTIFNLLKDCFISDNWNWEINVNIHHDIPLWGWLRAYLAQKCIEPLSIQSTSLEPSM